MRKGDNLRKMAANYSYRNCDFADVFSEHHYSYGCRWEMEGKEFDEIWGFMEKTYSVNCKCKMGLGYRIATHYDKRCHYKRRGTTLEIHCYCDTGDDYDTYSGSNLPYNH